MTPTDVKSLTAALAAPFELKEVKFKPQSVKGNRALALAYIDARVIEDRLDEVVGVEGWQDEYETLADSSVVCRLKLKLGEHWVTKMDVGSPSEQPDSGDRMKAAFSDALKRAAVKFGIGRYLYRFARPVGGLRPGEASVQPEPATPRVSPCRRRKWRNSRRKPAKSALPANGQELHRRLRDFDAKLSGQKLCAVGALLSHVANCGRAGGLRAGPFDVGGAGDPVRRGTGTRIRDGPPRQRTRPETGRLNLKENPSQMKNRFQAGHPEPKANQSCYRGPGFICNRIGFPRVRFYRISSVADLIHFDAQVPSPSSFPRRSFAPRRGFRHVSAASCFASLMLTLAGPCASAGWIEFKNDTAQNRRHSGMRDR